MSSVRIRGRALTFGKNSTFQVELRRRVDAYFELSGRRQRDCWQMYVKTPVAGIAADPSRGGPSRSDPLPLSARSRAKLEKMQPKENIR